MAYRLWQDFDNCIAQGVTVFCQIDEAAAAVLGMLYDSDQSGFVLLPAAAEPVDGARNQRLIEATDEHKLLDANPVPLADMKEDYHPG